MSSARRVPRTASGSRLAMAALALPPRPTPPPRANSLAGIFAKPPTTHPAVNPALPRTPAPSAADAESHRSRRYSEFNVHARANTAPVGMRRRCDSPVEDFPRLGATNGTTVTVVTNTTSGDTNTNTHTNTHWHTNTNMNTTNHKPTPSLQGSNLGRAGSASRRVFLGPQNVMHLPVLRLA
ncbi:hypothetical protein B0H16DRAFT_1777074 [Mycena metata]|uniref:Uncharacterized protein n=1 Tax=Mycena metata TaxID=1033252 RepID=A0AAD7JQU2_9AGAR|nr:hypothetical protein B0H16DRAFT_1777074 [Mycena metata]